MKEVRHYFLLRSHTNKQTEVNLGKSDRGTKATCDSLTTAKVSSSAEWLKIYCTPCSPLLNCRSKEKRGMFTITQQPCRQRGIHQIRGGGGEDKMFTTEVDDWILISHSTFTRYTSLPQRWANTSSNEMLLSKMTCCQTLRRDTPSLPLSAPLSLFYSMHPVTHCGAWWRGQVAFSKSNASLTTLNMSTYHITYHFPQLLDEASDYRNNTWCWHLNLLKQL